MPLVRKTITSLMTPLTAVALGLVGAAVVGAACTRRSGDLEVTLADGNKLKISTSETLRVNVATEPPTLDWHKAIDTTSTGVILNLMEGLTQYDLKSPLTNSGTSSRAPELVPALARKWEALDGGRKWKFALREGVKWSDGVPFTAQHVADGWKRALSAETIGADGHFLYGIKNARAFTTGKKPWAEVGVQVVSPAELLVELEQPMSFFPFLFRSVTTFPVRLDLIAKYGDRWTEPGHLATLGPFVLKAWTHDKMLVLERNEAYYGEKPAVKYVVAYMIQEETTALNLYQSGQLDSVHNIPSIQTAKLRGRPDFHDVPMLRSHYYGFNVTKPPTDDPKIRRAIGLAIDREDITQMLGGGERPQSAWIPPGLLGNDTPEGAAIGLKFDPAAARALLKEAGYGPGGKPLKLEIKFNTNEDHKRIAEIIQAQLKKNLGADVELRNEEWKVYLSSLKSDPPGIFRLGWQAGYADPDDFMNVMLSFSENNRTRWKNPKYDELVIRAAATSVNDERVRLYAQAEKILLEDDVAIIPLYTPVGHVLVAPRVEHYPLNSVEATGYRYVTLKAVER